MRVLPKRLRALVLVPRRICPDGMDDCGWPDSCADHSKCSPSTAAASAATPPNNEVKVLNHVNRVLQWSRQWGSADAYRGCSRRRAVC